MPDRHPLADRLRLLADEIDSAHRYGVPIPEYFLASHAPFGGEVSAQTERPIFDAWVEYLSSEPTSTVSEDRHGGRVWHTVAATISEGRLPLQLHVAEPDETAVAS